MTPAPKPPPVYLVPVTEEGGLAVQKVIGAATRVQLPGLTEHDITLAVAHVGEIGNAVYLAKKKAGEWNEPKETR